MKSPNAKSLRAKRKWLLQSTILAATAAASLTPHALAQTAPAADKTDTIVITATRRESTVQEAPINIAAVGGEQIEEQGFSEISDVLAYVPGINLVDGGGRQGNPIIVRGLNADPLSSGDGQNDGGGTVATYLGEIPVFVDLKLNDMQRVEVLLGPQGTLYGAGTLGGAIRYIPNKPDFAKDSLSVRAESFKYSEAESISGEAGFTFNKTITDNFAIRGSLDFAHDTGFIDQPYLVRQIGVSEPDPDFTDPADVAANLYKEKDVDYEDVVSGRLAARWAPLDWLDGTLTYYFQEEEIGGRRLSSRRSTVPAGKYENAMRVKEPNTLINNLLALEVTADLGFAELTSATGYSTHKNDGNRDQTDLLITLEYSYETFPTFTAFTHEQGKEERFNQEVRLVSKTPGPLNWLVGAFYNEHKTVDYSSEFTPGYSDFIGGDPGADLEYFDFGHDKKLETALFGEIGYEVLQDLTVTLGARAYKYELKAYSGTDFPLGDGTYVAPSLDEIKSNPYDPTLNQKDDGVLGKINVAWKATPDVLVYGTISEGYRIGDTNGVEQCDPVTPGVPPSQSVCGLALGQEYYPGGPGNVSVREERFYTSDKTTNYEIGAKTAWLNGALIVNGALYFVEWSDPQLQSATLAGNQPITLNGNGAESKGVELSAAWQVDDAFNIRGSYSYTKSELSEDFIGAVRTITPPGFGDALVDGAKGDRLPGSPEHSFSVFGTYKQPFMGGELQYNAGYSWQGDVESRIGGRGNGLTLKSYGIANASVVYDAGDWKASVFVNNIFDEYAETGVRSTELFNQTILGANVRSYGTFIAPPRAIGVRLSWDVF